MNNLDNDFCYSFPAVRGVQAGRPFYIATCPLRIIPKIFIYDEEEVPPELRAQRTLNKTRIPEMSRYLVDNPDDYVFSALTASVGNEVSFIEQDGAPNIGTLKVSMNASILINDGQHRRAAIEEAIKHKPELGQDNIAIVFYIDEGLHRSQQMFADLNQHAIRPSSSLSTLYDDRDPGARVAKYLANTAKPFIGFTEMEKSSIPIKSNKIFALSAIKHATRALLQKGPKDAISEEEKQSALRFWNDINDNMLEWKLVQDKKLAVSEFRQEYLTAHGIALQAIANVGSLLIQCPEKEQHAKLRLLQKIDWRRSNPEWVKRAMMHGKLSKASSNIFLTALEIKRQLGLKLHEDDLLKEQDLLAS
ncbi:DNA sulfur modification protein DndB [Alteromonas aestuariivivens]|uniref:DNA sulfur modification protein DndB n=1 Tax=Alteromonas aestuariivivens TaxID=1938339 RepID=A0A3D8M2I9_9ALTE|nr:DNA sulfur modification protein DndB [Alteromonas aestuariivivens]RDV23909.1 DNA sulfur modification protein DndB [Alteromonas aestuariivivens]